MKKGDQMKKRKSYSHLLSDKEITRRTVRRFLPAQLVLRTSIADTEYNYFLSPVVSLEESGFTGWTAYDRVGCVPATDVKVRVYRNKRAGGWHSAMQARGLASIRYSWDTTFEEAETRVMVWASKRFVMLGAQIEEVQNVPEHEPLSN